MVVENMEWDGRVTPNAALEPRGHRHCRKRCVANPEIRGHAEIRGQITVCANVLEDIVITHRFFRTINSWPAGLTRANLTCGHLFNSVLEVLAAQDQFLV
jgi:hypothetical protein